MKDKHIEAFKQEALELLDVLESSLIELESKPDDGELIGKVFRALHTIKGSGGMFGFDDIASFVHDIENIYDRIRNNELRVSNRIIDLTLKAGDYLGVMLKRDDKIALKDDQQALEILSYFREYIGDKSPTEGIEDEHHELPLAGETVVYHVVFAPNEDFFLNGSRPTGILNELKGLGNIVIIPDAGRLPSLADINPEKIYISWEIFLSTAKGMDSIKDVFIFAEDDCKITITEIDKGELKGNSDYYKSLISKSGNAAPVKKAEEKKVSKKENVNTVEHHKTHSKEIKNDNLSSIRVNSIKLDKLVDLVGELVTVQARLSEIAGKNNIPNLVSVSEDVERLTWELRDNALNIRMLPIGSTFNKFIRLVRDLSKELGKEVELVTAGAETELDKNVIEKLNDPLIHIIRNSIDHGIEDPEIRLKNNKERNGKIFLSAMHSGTHVLIKIKDDGAGLNKETIYKKAIERGIIQDGTELSDNEIYSLIFKAGFSTSQKVTNVSGRGVGMDVVRTAIESLRGTVELESKMGEGTTITLKLPLTLAIIEGLIVRIDEDFFAIPLSYVEECIELTSEAKSKTHGRNIINVRNEFIPYIPLRENFNISNNQPSIEQIVIVNENNFKVGILVDEIIGEHQTVIKTLGKYYKSIEVVSGATVLGDGTVALIIDVPKLISGQIHEEELLVAGEKE